MGRPIDIRSWLRELGLERYAQAFLDNDIDAEVLPRLTADELKELGVTSIGHRRRLLDAIAALERPSPSPEGPDREVLTTASPAPPHEAPVPEAERRQLTILFCDLVGSTELASRLDPEDMGRVIRAYQDCCTTAIGTWGGHVAKYMGDGLLAYFGYPKAQEDEAERAVRAGLEVVAGVRKLGPRYDLAMEARVGIATGQVVVGELLGEGAAQERAVVGETPNMASRLQNLAPPGGVVIGLSTRRLLGTLFDLVDLGERELKGFAAPVRAWQVVGEGVAESRFEALRGRQLTPLVGREHELGLLLERWAWAKDGSGQVVLLSGEPGIGKSRIVSALRERLAEERYIPLSHYCSPYHQNSALYPVIGLLERAAGFTREDPPAARLDKLSALLAPATEKSLEQVVPLIAALLSIPTAERYPPIDLSPQQQKQRTFEVLVDQMEGLARRQPVLATYEDIQWMDPSTRELLDLLVERVRHLPVLVVMTFRPDFQPPWTGHAHVARVTLNRLGPPHGAAMVQRITGGKSLPAEVLAQIVGKTDGVPLFVEELTKAVLESGLLTDAGDHFELAGALPDLAIPATLQDSLMARLDRLAPVKEVAQIGAVIGRTFSYDLLARVATMPQDGLRQALDRLIAAELIHHRGAPPDATYTFKHALVQDAAYQSLLRSRRRQLHARIAETLDEHFPELLGAQPEVVAHHYTEAGGARRAIDLWQEAGEREARRSAHLEAIAHFSKALSLMGDLPAEVARSRRELELLLLLGPVLIAAQGMASDCVAETYRRARELSRELGDPDGAYTSTWGLWLSHQQRGVLDEAQQLAREVLALAEQTGKAELLLQAHHAAWTTLFFQDDLPACLAHTEQGRALYDLETHRAHALRFGGHDPGVCAGATGGLALWLVGFPDQAVARLREASELAERLDHPVSHSIALFFTGILHQYRREPARVRAHLDTLLTVCRERHIPHYESSRAILHGWVETAEGNVENGIAEIQHGLDLHMQSPVGLRRPYYLGVFADALARSGDVEAALAAVDKGLMRRQRADDRNWEPELHRLRGELLRRDRGLVDAEVEHCFDQAVAAARRQGAKSLELRAATSRARLWAEQGERQKARDLLAPIYDWFTEGFDTADLRDAKGLLDQLA